MLKSLAKRVLIKSGATRVAARLAGQGVAILMYHSVADDPEQLATTLGGIGHSSKIFQRQMELLARAFHPISLDDACGFLRGARELPRRSVVITFDDGYADNYEQAMPVLNKIGLPATFYITVECVQQKRLPWPCRARYALFTTRKADWLAPDGQCWPLPDLDRRARAFDRACEFCARLAGSEQDQFLSALESQLHCHLQEGPAMMTWDQVRGAVQQGHTIGSHTMSHPNMAHIPQGALRHEMTESKKILETELERPIVHFSYPCPALQPHWSEETVRFSQECGYQTGVTTNGGLVRKNDNPLRLRRIRPSKDVDGLRANLEFAFLGRRA